MLSKTTFKVKGHLFRVFFQTHSCQPGSPETQRIILLLLFGLAIFMLYFFKNTAFPGRPQHRYTEFWLRTQLLKVTRFQWSHICSVQRSNKSPPPPPPPLPPPPVSARKIKISVWQQWLMLQYYKSTSALCYLSLVCPQHALLSCNITQLRFVQLHSPSSVWNSKSTGQGKYYKKGKGEQGALSCRKIMLCH